jgi:myo-inositol-1(or 4)-monophosphatase
MSNEPTPAALLTLALEAAGAGAAILATRTPLTQSAGLVAADDKSAAGDWVTDFDRSAERAVRETIAAARPDDTLTGEEYPDSVGADGHRWSIDPLDGTVNFVRGIAYYATSVAVSGPVPENTMPDASGSASAGSSPAEPAASPRAQPTTHSGWSMPRPAAAAPGRRRGRSPRNPPSGILTIGPRSQVPCG